MKNKIAILICIVLISVLIAKLSLALSCSPRPTEYRFLNADVVFTGKVENIEELGKQDETYVKSKAILNVEEVFKGELINSITVSENIYYGATFKENERYLVFANFVDKEFSVGPCSGTRNIKYISDEFKKIERIKQLIQGELDFIRNFDEGEELKYEISITDDGSIEYKEFDEKGRLTWLDIFKGNEHKSKQFFESGRYSYLEFIYRDGKLVHTKGYDQNGKLILDKRP